MTTKIYGIYGRSTALVRIPTGKGKAFISVEFDRGVPNIGPNYRPATYSTSDPIEQSILEKSPMFNNLYTLYRIYKEETPVAAVKETKVKDIEPLEGITTKAEAVEYLKGRGAKAVNLKDAAAILKYAEKIGVSFPNLTL